MKLNSIINVSFQLIFYFYCTGLFCQISYSSISENQFFVGEGRIGIYRFDLDTNYKTITSANIMLNSYFPFCWKKDENKIIIAYGYGRMPSNGTALLRSAKIETRDSLSAMEDYVRIIDSLEIIFGDENKAIAFHGFSKSDLENPRGFSPIEDWFSANYMISREKRLNDIIAYASYDLIPLGNSKYRFYVRNKYELTVWDYQYPALEVDPRESGDWQEEKTYSRISTLFEPEDDNPRYVIASGNKHFFQSIQDSLFFHGHFKAIQQNQNTFLINEEHGAIYYLGPAEIIKVGQIQNMAQYPTWVLEKPIFIEDRDQGVLIFFSIVDRLREDLPFPNIVEMTNETEVREIFKHVK